MAKSQKSCEVCGKPVPRKDYATCGGMCAEELRRRTKNAHKPAKVATSTVSGDSWIIDDPKCTAHTLDDLIAKYKVDLTVWEPHSFQARAWDGPGPEGSTQQFHHSKASFRKRPGVDLALQVIADHKADLKKYRPRPIKVRRAKPKAGDCMLEIGPLDHHFGKLAWGLETGDENYDFNIARDLYREAVEAQVARVSGYGISRVCFVVGHDMLHVNGSALQTFNGTQMDFDSRYARVFRGTRRLLVDIISGVAANLAPVEVKVVPGNHDKDSAFHLGDSLECWFHDDPHVKVDNEPRKRKYVEHGAVMLMLSHGEEFVGRRAMRVPTTMLAEQPAMVGRTRFREAHMGHLHHKITHDEQGFITRWFSALCPPDAWHSSLALVGSQRSAEALVWHPEEGLIGTAVYSHRQQQEAA